MTGPPMSGSPSRIPTPPRGAPNAPGKPSSRQRPGQITAPPIRITCSRRRTMPMTVTPLDPAWLQRAAEYQARLTMPAGALGRLLDLGRQLCAVQETLAPRAEPAAALVLAADHGIAAEGVSAYPQ